VNRAGSSDVSTELRDYAHVVWSRKWSIVAVVAVLVVAAAMFTARQTRIYQASAEILVRPVRLSPTDPANVGDFMNMEPERRLAQSVEVAKLAAPALAGLDEPAGISVSAPDQTNTLIFQASSPSPRASQQTAQAYAEAYLEFRLDQVLDDLRAASEPLQDRIETLTGQIEAVQDDLAVATTESARTALQIRSNSLFTQQAFLEQKLNELVLPENLQVGNVLQPAGLPTAPSSPNVGRTISLAILLGLALGVAQAFVRNRLDARLRTSGELEAGAGAPVLAVIPYQRRSGPHGSAVPELVTLTDPAGPVAQSYKVLRAAIQFLARSAHLRTIVVTSAHAGEGKSVTAANLAVSLAQSGEKVTLVSADLHRPSLERLFGVMSEGGLADVFWKRKSLEEALVLLTTDELHLLSSGVRDRELSELIGTRAMATVLAEAAQAADFVIIDTPPVLEAADALGLAPLADAVIIVADAQRSTYDGVQRARQRLQQVGANVVGAVMNNADKSMRDGEGYGEYGSDVAPAASPASVSEWSA